MSEDKDIPRHRQCGICFPGLGGVGVAYCTQGRTRYYKCNKCANTWKVTVEVQITARPTDLDIR